jgi:hypothetical protein
MSEPTLRFWSWFVRGSGARPGYTRLVNEWMALHAAVGFFLGVLVSRPLESVAGTALFPLAGILIGLSLAWAGNAQALLQSPEISQLADEHAGGFVEYVFVFQLAVLIILATMVVWGIAGLGVFDDLWPTPLRFAPYLVVKTVLLAMFSMTIRECWQVVMGTQLLLIARRLIEKARQVPPTDPR